jgi:hypothetical protein
MMNLAAKRKRGSSDFKEGIKTQTKFDFDSNAIQSNSKLQGALKLPPIDSGSKLGESFKEVKETWKAMESTKNFTIHS